MFQKLLKFEYLEHLEQMDPIWYSLGPLFAFNLLLLATLAYFTLTYAERKTNQADIDNKEHSRLLSRFLKQYWYWFISPAEKLCLRYGVSPNALTLMGFFTCCASAYFFHLGMIGLGGWFMIFGSTFDMFDGRIARLTGKESPSGAFFDSVMDRFSEAVVFLGLASFYRNTWVLYAIFLGLIGSMMVSYTRARGEGIGVDCKIGIMQRPERIVYLGVGSIFSPVFAYFISFFYPMRYDFMTIGAIAIIALLTPLSSVSRMRYIIKKSEAQNANHSTPASA